jgi:hypothetical protein
MSTKTVYAVLDIEAWKSDKFALGIIYFPDSDKYLEFREREEMRDFLISIAKTDRKSATKIIFFGHNIAYDLNKIFGNYEIFFSPQYKTENNRKRYFIDCLARKGRFYYAKYHNLEFRDTFNLFSMGLEKAGKIVGIPIDKSRRKKFENNANGHIEPEDVEYCKMDCLTTWRIYEKCRDWVESHGGKIKLTIASSGLTILKQKNPMIVKYIKAICKSEKLPELDENFRLAYFGGRVEVHQKTGINLFYYDVNSLYPSVMANEKMFYPDPRTLFEYSGDLQFALNNYEGMAKISFTIPKTIMIPVLPYKDITKNKIIYPVGRITGNWCFPEIRLALEMGYIPEKVHKIICAKPIRSPWFNYCMELYSERKQQKENGDSTEEITKIYLNSLYGKFGQRDFDDKIISVEEANEIFGNKGEMFETFEYQGREMARYSTEPMRSKSNILSLASYVTSYARSVIYDYYRKVGFENVYYSDTDSLITSVELPTSKNLGEMKLEHKIEYAKFYGRKDYYIIAEGKAIIKRKGFSLKFATHLFKDGEKIDITEELKEKFIAGDIETLALYYESDKLVLDKILKSREAIRRKKEASTIVSMEKVRGVHEDNGREWKGENSKPLTIEESV